MVNWDPVSAIAGVVAATAAIIVLPFAYRQIPSSRKNTKEQCEQFDWLDIRPGQKLHECHGVCLHGFGNLHDSARCWEKELGTVFSRAWAHSARVGRRTVPKPPQLSAKRNYICTDARTIKAFILCTVGCFTDGEFNSPGLPWSPEDLRFNGTHVDLREVSRDSGKKVVVAHLEGMLRENLTKGDVEGILAGYPPWYRETVCLPLGRSVSNPIKTKDDITRAGWVIGVGLSGQKPLEAAHRSKIFSQKPITRLYEILIEKIYPAFSNDTNLYTVSNAIWQMIDQRTESGIFIDLHDVVGNVTDELVEITKLSEAEATFVMELFNSPPNIALTDEEIARIQPILLPLLHAAFRGAYTVVKALKNVKSIYGADGWHELLRDPKRKIYVEDCGD